MKGQLNIKNPEGVDIIIEHGYTFEKFVSQFQKYSSKILCIVDNKYLHYYQSDQTPCNVIFSKKITTSTITHYYFNDLELNKKYCVFGRKAAKAFCQDIDYFDPCISGMMNNIISSVSVPSEDDITIIDNGVTLSFNKIICNFETYIKNIDKNERILENYIP
jgi:hypothetical protein